jgi:uncharacterized protein
MLRLLFSVVFLCLCLNPALAKRVALVVGNNIYSNFGEDLQLQKAVNDAAAMRDTLKDLGFEVIYLQDANLTDFKKAVFAFSAKIEKGDVAAFFYAGHGAALKGTNYLLPSDVLPVTLSTNPNEAEIESQVSQLAEFSIKEALILEHMAKREPQVSLVIVDACRNNPLRDDTGENAFRSTTANGVVLGDNFSTAEKSIAEGMIIVYSAGFGQQALDRLSESDKDPNSPFTRTLLKQLKQPGQGLGTVVKNTKEEVFKLAKSIAHKQTPSVYDQLFGGDIFLNGEPELAKVVVEESKAEAPKAIVEAPKPDIAQAAFEAAGENVEMLKIVEQSFPDSVWAKLATSKIEGLEKKLALLAVPENSTVPPAATPKTKCDELASIETIEELGIRRVEYDSIDAFPAIEACRDSLKKFPGDKRLQALLGRALDKSGNFTEAFTWYQKSAGGGYALAMTHLGFRYEEGYGVAVNKVEAVKFYRKAAELGEVYGMANLGWMYRNGEGVAVDRVEALKWTRKAAELGHASGMTNLGLLYYFGEGVNVDKVEAAKWYRKAAELGDVDGMADLGVMYLNGEGVAFDRVEALKWTRKAAGLGNARAMNNLGQMYELGEGIAIDKAEAVKWYRKAAEAGDADGMKNLAIKLRIGMGVKRNIKEAEEWERKAQTAGGN